MIGKARLKISDYKKGRRKKGDEKNKKLMAVSLSLTSMVDMFAILVIFLLTNTGSVQEWIKVSHQINLPKAKSEDQSKKATTIQVTEQDVFVEEEKIINVGSIKNGPIIIPSLKKYLANTNLPTPTTTQKKDDTLTLVNIVADEKVPFGAMKRIMATCQGAGFSNLNLAISPKN